MTIIEQMKFSKVFVLVRKVDRDLSAIKASIDIARNNNTSLIILYAIDGFIASGQVDAGRFPEEVKADLVSDAHAFLENIKKDYGFGLEIEPFIKVGNIKKLLQETSKEHQVDLIVLGPERRNIFQRISKASFVEFTSTVLRIPVLSVP